MRKINLGFIKYITIGLVLICTAGCSSNSYRLKKVVDVFNPIAGQTFEVEKTIKVNYSNQIATTFINKLKALSLVYSPSGGANYMVYFDFAKRLHRYYTLSVILVKQYATGLSTDRVVYKAQVNSYNNNALVSLASSLKIITDDLLYKSHPKGGRIYCNGKSYLKKSNSTTSNSQQALNIKSSAKQTYKSYSLFAGHNKGHFEEVKQSRPY